MTEGEAKYLRARPAILHVPALHLFVAHAGVLPYDTTRKPTHASQPLARAPHGDASTPLDERRRAQETGVLEEVWQNVDPWTPLHMRAVRRDGSLSKCVLSSSPFSEGALMDRQGGEGGHVLGQDMEQVDEALWRV